MSPNEMPPSTIDEEQILAEMEREFNPDVLALGDIALLAEIDTSYIEAGINEVALHANSEAEDQRIHDVDAAFDMALQENELLDAHAEALAQNEIFDAHLEALRQNEIFDAHTAAIEENEEHDKRRAEQREADTLQQEKLEADYSEPAEIIDSGFRKQAEAALKDAGYTESIPLDSHIQKDLAGNLTVINANDVKIIESHPGGRTRVTEYAYDEDTKVLTVRAGGNTILTAQAGDYVKTDANNWQHYGDVVTLPPSVAKTIGIEKVIPIAEARR